MKRRVLVFGTFDGLHEGHRAFLRQARQMQIRADDAQMNADDSVRLIVVVARDEVVEKLKGRKSRKEQGLRIKELMETGLMDEVVEGDAEIGRWEVIGKIKPDIIALGYDQVALKEALEEYVRENGLRIEVRVMKAYKPEEFHSSIISKS
ncbi:hypothetical protein A3A21_01260 [Candidatus Jorgensenbacteria bacterium RIFCSPLOWO2_01_FULL_45_25b]|uniref:Cytidyltransferase-like domain-containing protein n=1 Tax=Candidatus Jorgensenbacteria bacterium RIFCSPLOWO2_01_FULL_45_25b TaxID=1798471 RepID=A0A1F6BVX8_9BACT|nr:MAG: hypothetical protein A3A21_01260 [Candidatus Jorgensenbacteria bacterium RIFCSPLOWO2_01_FULL_45_25b]